MPRPDPVAVCNAIRSGQTLRQTAMEFGVSISLIYVICRQEGVKLKTPITLATRQAIVDDARNGATIMSLMRKYKVSYHRVRSIIDRSGSQPMKDSSRRVLKAVALLLNTRMTFEEIGRELNTSGQRIHQIYKDATSAGIRFEHRKI
jgi:DNA-directed RNA polymerase sigma subunit (sigma70/sigma32)